MLETQLIPDDLATCQQLLRELAEAYAQLQRVHQELLDTCTSLQAGHQQLGQERDELQLRITRLLQQLYGRRSERWQETPGQQHLSFNDDLWAAADPTIVSAVPPEEPLLEYLVRRRTRSPRPRSEQLPEHLERRTERIEPTLPAGVQLADCAPLGVDVVETLQFERAKAWVRRLEYPKYKLPAPAATTPVAAQPRTAAVADVSRELRVDAAAVAPAAVPTVAAASAAPARGTTPETGWTPPSSDAHDKYSDSSQAVPRVTNQEPDMQVNIDSAASPSLEPTPPAVEPTSPAVEPTSPAVEPTSPAVEPTSPAAELTSPSAMSEAPARSVRPPLVEPHGIIQAPREPALCVGGRYGFGVAAEVLFNKFVLHVPLYRQQDMWAQSGWSPSRSTLCQIVTAAAELLAPLAELLRQQVLASPVLGTDDSPITLLTPGVKAGSRQARFWLYRGREAAPFNVFAFTDSRERAGPDRFLEPFRGTLTGDCYSGYVNIEQVTRGRIRFAGCLAHARRKVFETREQHPGLSSQVLALFRELYDVEDRARPLDELTRHALRQQESVPLMVRLRQVLASPAALGVLPKSRFGEALAYLRNHWDAFQVYLQDGRLPIDNNDVERDLRRVALARKNWLFVGSQEAGDRTATILSVVSSAHRHDLDGWAYLRDTLEQLARGSALASLLPDAWKATHPDQVRTFREQEKETRAAARRDRRATQRRDRGTPGSSTD